MCDYFHQQTMENYQGDLADIIRAGGGPISGTLGSSTTTSSSFGDPLLPTTDSWQFLHSDLINFPSDDFGHPFSSLRDDPLLLQDLDMSAAGSSFFTSSNGIENTGGLFGQKINNIDHQEIKRNNNFSRMLQISPNNNAKLSVDSPMTSASPRLLKPPPPTLISANDHMISVNSSKGTSCLIENTGVQISSPRNTGIKRRKSQAKKVVCIPAPAPANSRPTGEIVPSDLWAWRKYGQKPIKGSPYPRGYYRCSSSKGCSARKQVERSRTDPNMLVITYTSEHNHPWPTQRNALAGSTRTQPAKNINSPATSKTSPQKAPLSSLKEEEKESINIDNNVSSSIDVTGINSSTNVKEEEMEEKEITEMEGGDQFSDGFPPLESYKPALPDSNNSDQDFFADLGEIGGDDPLSLLFTQGFSGDEGRESSKALDPFIFYDWTVGNSNSNSNNTTSSFGDQAKRGL